MRILLVGDSHGSATWWQSSVSPAAVAARADLIVQLGDFGYWPSATRFLDAVSGSHVPVWFLDGNHEHFPSLWGGREEAKERSLPVEVARNITYLPRGTRFSLEGISFAVLGGARSIDRTLRTPGESWFAEEAISEDDLIRTTSGPCVDVLLSHDAPSSAPVPLMDDEFLPAAWLSERPACAEHRRLLETALCHLQPGLVAHGHYHVRYDATCARSWGDTRFVGLSHNGTHGAFAVLECSAGEWRIEE